MNTKLFSLFILLLCSCGNSIHSGTVIQKYYEPERHYTYVTYIYVAKNMIPQVHTGFDDEDFVIEVKKGDIKEIFYLDKNTWDSIKIGQYFTDTIK